MVFLQPIENRTVMACLQSFTNALDNTRLGAAYETQHLTRVEYIFADFPERIPRQDRIHKLYIIRETYLHIHVTRRLRDVKTDVHVYIITLQCRTRYVYYCLLDFFPLSRPRGRVATRRPSSKVVPFAIAITRAVVLLVRVQRTNIVRGIVLRYVYRGCVFDTGTFGTVGSRKKKK